jgi:hypothetical protein
MNPIEVLFEVTFFDVLTDKKIPNNEAFTFVQNQCYFKVGYGLEENSECFDVRYNRHYRMTEFSKEDLFLERNKESR